MLDEPIGTDEMISAILPYLDNDNEVIRCAAVRALGTRTGQPCIRTALLDLLRDEDPDVRSDAMEALVPLARPEDADVIRDSFMGDPVREVKLAAIRILAGLRDQDSIALFRALCLDKCEDRVAWEDDLGDWEDWLDIQIAVIEALGLMGVTDAIEDMLAAMDDEMGQTLDTPVFRALSRMGREGTVWLLATVQTARGLARTRAAGMLANTDPAALAEFAGELVAAEDPALRLLALPHLSADDPAAEQLSCHDPSTDVRCAGLRRFAGVRPDWVLQALSDTSETVQACALGLLPLPVDEDMHGTLVDNCLAWLGASGPALASAAAALLPRVAPNRAAGPLADLSMNAERPIAARLAAMRALATLSGADIVPHLRALLSSRAQQIRLVALHELRDRAAAGDAVAMDILVAAVDQTLLDEEDRHQPLTFAAAPDVAQPKGEGGSGLRISPDGEILSDAAENPADRSTLAAIQTVGARRGEPVAQTPARRRRVAVAGSDAVAEDLCRAAMDICADMGSVRIAAATLGHLNAQDDILRQSAWRSLRVGGPACVEARIAAAQATGDALPEVRRHAYCVVLAEGGIWPDKALSDSDALIRAESVAYLDAARLPALLGDPSPIVRKAALGRLLGSPDPAVVAQTIDAVLASEKPETIAHGLALSGDMRTAAANTLAGAPDRRAFLILEAVAQAGKRV